MVATLEPLTHTTPVLRKSLVFALTDTLADVLDTLVIVHQSLPPPTVHELSEQVTFIVFEDAVDLNERLLGDTVILGQHRTINAPLP